MLVVPETLIPIPIDSNKTNKQMLFEILKWLITLVFIAAGIFYGTIFETKTHADDTFVKKEVQAEVNKNRDRQIDNIMSALGRIEIKIDEHMEKSHR